MSESVEDIASNRKLACGTLDSLARVHFPCIPLLLMLYSQKDVCVFFLRRRINVRRYEIVAI